MPRILLLDHPVQAGPEMLLQRIDSHPRNLYNTIHTELFYLLREPVTL